MGKVLEFGEMVFAKPLRKDARKRSLKSKVLPGIWLGLNSKTRSNIVALFGGGPVIRVRTVFRRPESERWDAEEILKIRAAPRRPNPFNDEQEEPTSVSETAGFEI